MFFASSDVNRTSENCRYNNTIYRWIGLSLFIKCSRINKKVWSKVSKPLSEDISWQRTEF